MGLVSSQLDCVLTVDTKASWKVPIQSSDIAVKEFDMNAIDPLSKEKWCDLYERAKNNFLPSYAVAVVEYKYPISSSTKIKIYDGVTFYKQFLKNPHQFTKRKREISSIHYLAAKCFDFDSNYLKKDIKSESIIFSDFLPNEIENDTKQQAMWLDTVNYIVEKNFQCEDQIGKLQFVVANYLSHCSEKKWQEEAMRWYWCSAERNIDEANDKIVKFFRNGHILNQNKDTAEIWEFLHAFYLNPPYVLDTEKERDI